MSNIESSQENFNESDFDFGAYYSLLKRHSKLISFLTGLSFLLSAIISFTIKKTWEGQFQIVVSDLKSITGKLSPGIANSNIRDFLKPSTSNLKTQVEILKSPSVLMPIFNKLKNLKIESGNNRAKKWIFTEWRDKNLDINLMDGTKILELKFRDQDKSLILPILDEISLTYQKYAINKDSKQLEESINYFNTQIINFEKINENAQRKLDKFILENNLIGIKDIDKSNAKVFNEIKSIDAELKGFDKKNFDTKNISNYDQKNYPKLINEIINLDKKISAKKLLYKENDKSINLLKKEREMLIKKRDITRYSYLVNRKNILTNILETSIWDQDTLITYKELKREVVKYDKTLDYLEKIKLNLELERAKTSEPWELITNPTILDYPVAPSKKLIVFISTIIGFLISLSIAKDKDKKEDLTRSYKEVEYIMDSSILYKFELDQKESWDEIFSIFSSKIKNEFDDFKIALIPIGNIKKELSKQFQRDLNSCFSQDLVDL